MKTKLILLGLASFALVAALCVNLKGSSASPAKEVSKTESLDELVKQFNPVEQVEAFAYDSIF